VCIVVRELESVQVFEMKAKFESKVKTIIPVPMIYLAQNNQIETLSNHDQLEKLFIDLITSERYGVVLSFLWFFFFIRFIMFFICCLIPW
jgi:hypothetical protein